ncbi:hypothetical protein CEXT_355341 [Caerostris extrusa]|uniref:Uncharacterized protein n=1 Tax=Caerostris extrusa TaxID=172846 RepID=A0AAV4NTL6_CAEEX|nr:hypothetical protein CEXT_355341 [Caerostris extrusa]
MSEIVEIRPIKLGWGKKYEITSSKSRDLGEGSSTLNKMGVGAEWRMLPDEMSTTGKRDDHFAFVEISDDFVLVLVRVEKNVLFI